MNSATRLTKLVRLQTGFRLCSSCPKPKKSAENPAALNASKKFLKMKANQCKYQLNDGQPIFLKAGFRDKALYQITWLLLLIGLTMNIKLFYDLAKPHQ